MTMAQVTDVVFDLGRVLIDFSYDDFFPKLWQRGANFSDVEEFAERVELIRYEHGELSNEQFLDNLNGLLKQPLPADQLLDYWNDLFAPIPEMLDLGRKLRDHCGVFMLSNTSDLHWRYLLEAYPLDEICHDRLASWEVGVMKPDPRIFHQACQRFGLQPATSVFIDDLKANVAGARACGWHGIHHVDVETTRRQLSQLTGLVL